MMKLPGLLHACRWTTVTAAVVALAPTVRVFAENPQAAEIEAAIRQARQHGYVAPDAQPGAGARGVLRAFYCDQTSAWLRTFPAMDLIEAIPWGMQIPVSPERLSVISGLMLRPDVPARDQLPEVKLAEALYVELTSQRALNLEEFHALALRVVAVWAAGNPPWHFELAVEFLGNAILDEHEKVRMPNCYAEFYSPHESGAPMLACVALGPRAADLVPNLARTAVHESLSFNAVTMLGLLAPQNPSAVQALVELLRTPAAHYAAMTIEDRAGSAAIELLQALLKDADPDVRERAAGLLHALAGSAPIDSGALLDSLGDPNTAVVWNALRTLAAKPPPPSLVLRHFEALLKAATLSISSWQNGKETTPALLVAQIFDTAKPEVVCHLEDALRYATLELKWSAADAVRRILGYELAEVVYIKVLHDGDGQARMVAIRSLGRMGPAATLAIPFLRARIPLADSSERFDLQRALASIGED